MPNDLENLRCALRRQSTAGTRAILFLALIMFGPRAYDYIIGEPWITGSLSVLRSSDGRYLVEDTVTANNPVYGDRQILLETVDGTVLCSSRWSGSWDATTKRNWELSALAGASCQAPDRTFRICSIFRCTARAEGIGPSLLSALRKRTQIQPSRGRNERRSQNRGASNSP